MRLQVRYELLVVASVGYAYVVGGWLFAGLCVLVAGISYCIGRAAA